MVDTKRCSKCATVKPSGEFSKCRARPDGLQVWCRQCDAARRAAYRVAHLDEERAAQSAYQKAHRDLDHARGARYRAKYRDLVRARGRAYHVAHPEVGRAAATRRRAHKAAAFIEEVSVVVLAERDGGRCGICGKPVDESERSVDHILPLSRGGNHSYTNTRLAHGRCNKARSNRGTAQLRMVG